MCDSQFRVPPTTPDEDRCRTHRGQLVALPAPSPAAPLGLGPVETSVRSRLTDVDRADTPLGAAALKLALELDLARGVAAARIAPELAKLLDRALDGIAPAADGVDDLERLRRARRGA